jgi:antitoxin (DNA-binding transcriptional repressor) of toxin-antitoxin stability system
MMLIAFEAKNTLRSLLDRVERGEEIIIGGTPPIPGGTAAA